MGWTGQVLFQSLVAAAAALAALYLPWNELRIVAGVFDIYFLYAIGRNPRFILQRTIRFIVVATMPFLAAGISGRVGGTYFLPEGRGSVTFEFVQGMTESVWVIAAILVGCLALDGLLTWLESRGRKEVFEGAAVKPTLFLKRKGDVTFSTDLLVKGPAGGGTVGGANLCFAGLASLTVSATIHRAQRGKEPKKPAAGPVNIAAGKTAQLSLSGTLPDGLYRRWLRFRAGWLPMRLIPLQAFLQLVATPPALQQPLPLAFRISSAPPS
jgi:hypothetical protein